MNLYDLIMNFDYKFKNIFQTCIKKNDGTWVLLEWQEVMYGQRKQWLSQGKQSLSPIHSHTHQSRVCGTTHNTPTYNI